MVLFVGLISFHLVFFTVAKHYHLFRKGQESLVLMVVT